MQKKGVPWPRLIRECHLATCEYFRSILCETVSTVTHFISLLIRSCMSELTDFGDLMAAVGGKDGEYKDLKL